MGLAYSMTGQHQEAISACEKAVRLAPNSLYTQVSLTMAYGMSGREAEARHQAAEVLTVDPKFSVDAFAKRALTYKKQEDRSIDDLRKAGLK
jgi:tetratricopeptide (TPR) repeat protein